MEIEELCTRFTADLSDFRKKMATFTDDLKKASGVTDELRKEITNAMNSSCDKVRKFGKEMSTLVDKQVKTAEAIAATKTKLKDYETVLASIQEKNKKQREGMQKLIDKYYKLTAVQKKQKHYIDETDGGIEGIRKAREDITAYIHDMSAAYDELQNKIAGYGGLKPNENELNQLKQLEANIKAATDELTLFDSQLVKVRINPEKLGTQNFSSLGKEIESLRSRIGTLKQSEMDLTAKEESLNSVMANTAVKLENLKNKAAAGADSLNAMRNRLKSINSETITSNTRFKGFYAVIGKATRGVTSLAKSALGFLKNRLIGTGKSTTDLSGKLLNVTKSIKRIGVVALGLKLVKSVFGELRSIVSSCISSNEQLNSRVEALKNSFGKALAPAIELVTGLFEKLMPYVVSITNAISDLLASLGIGAALKSTSSAVDGVTDSTKKLSEAQNDLYGFDQITKVSDNSSDGTSSSGSTESYSASKKLSEYLQKLKDLWNSSDFEGVGSTIAGSLNKVIAKINALDWDGIQEKVNKTVGGITKSLNGFIYDFDWEGSAKILGNGINTVVGAINTFAVEFDWKGFGEKLADFLINAIKTIDWKKAGETIHNLITGLCDAISGFFDKLTEGDEGYETIKKAVTDFFSGLKIGEIALSIIKAILSIGQFSFNFVGNLFDDLWNWLLDKLGVEKNSVGAIMLKVPLKLIFTSLITGPLGSLSKLVSLVFGKKNVNEKGEVKINANTTVNGKTTSSFNKSKSLWDGIKDKKVTNTLNGKTSSGFVSLLKNFSSVKDKTNTVTTKGSVSNTFSALKLQWDSIKNKTNLNTIKGSVQNTFTSLKSKWDSIKNKSNTSTIKGSVSSAFNSAKSKWDSIKSKTVTVTANAKDKASSIFKSIANSLIKFINQAISKINSKLRISVGKTLSNVLKAIGVNVSKGSYQLFSIPSIPMLETGGIVSKPTVAMVGEHGKEAVMPLENNTGWITQLAHSIVAIMSGNASTSNQGQIIIPIYIGSKHITDVVIDDVNKRTKATGNCPIKV